MSETISVVILNYNAGDHILACIRSVEEQASEIVVVDNASQDDSLTALSRAFPSVHVISNERNMGFAVGANQAVRAATGHHVVLLNPDVTVAPGALEVLTKTLDAHPRAALVAPLVLNPDRTVQPTKRTFPSLRHAALHGIVGLLWRGNPGTRAYTLADARFEEAQTVDWVAPVAIAIRREAFEAVGGFDESFFFFVEDVDLCRRLWDEGWEVWFEPHAEVTHVWGASWTQQPLRFLWLHQRNLYRYWKKHRRGWRVLASPLVAAGVWLRFVLLAIRWLITRRSVPAHRSTGGVGD